MEIKSLYKKFLKYSKPTAPKSKVQSKKIDVSKKGLWDKNKNKVIVPSNRITMKGPKGEQDFFKRPVLATGLQSGKQVLMQPGREYYFPNDEQVFEKRMQSGGEFLLGAASFAPPPIGTAAGLTSAGINLQQGDLEGFGWDMAGVLTGGAAKWFKGASQAAKAAGAGRVARNMGDKARFLQTASNPNIYKTIGTARDYPNYNTPVQRTPQRESTYVAPRPRPIMQDGGTNPPDYSKFQEFNKTLPENLRNDNFKYNDPNTYDLYGMWEGSGKPNSFKDVQDGDFFPLQEDGTYHGFSVNPNTGEFLKPKNHATTWMEVKEGQLNPDLKNQLIIQNERGRLQYVPRTMQDGGTVQTNMLQPIKKDEESLPIILESLFSQFQKSREEFGVEPEESESMGTPSLQDGALVKDEDIRMDPIEINAELPPWYIRYPRKALRAANAKLEDWGAQYAQRISDATGGKDWYKEANPFGSLALEFINAPQYTATYGVTGKVQTPSEAMDIQNPVGAFLTNAVLDPTNLVGAGIAKNLGSDALRNMIRNRSRGTRPDFTPNVSNQLPDPPSELILNPNTGQFDAYYDSSRPYFDEWIRMMNNNATDLDVSNLFANNSIDVASSIDLRKLKKSKNLSGLTKDDILKNASPKDKEVLSKMSESEFEQTVLKPTGEIAVYEPAINLGLGFNTNTRNLTLRDSIPMGADEYTDIFNSRLDRLNEIISKNNKSGLDYSVKGLSPSGVLRFNTPAQIEKLPVSDKVINELKKRGLIDSEGNMSSSAQEYVNRWTNRNIPQGESTWMLDINPGQWRGEVEDIANAEYFKAIPGLNMRNTTASVFSDALPRRGTGAYSSINQYLKELDLGRVKPGFNSQTKSSSGLWQDAIKKEKAFGYFNDPTTVYGSMRTFAPLGIGAGMGISQLQNQKPAMQMGGMSIPGVNGTVIASTPSLYKKHKARRK